MIPNSVQCLNTEKKNKSFNISNGNDGGGGGGGGVGLILIGCTEERKYNNQIHNKIASEN